MNERMNEWMNEWMIEWKNKWMNEWMREQIDEWMNEGMNENMNSLFLPRVAIPGCGPGGKTLMASIMWPPMCLGNVPYWPMDWRANGWPIWWGAMLAWRPSIWMKKFELQCSYIALKGTFATVMILFLFFELSVIFWSDYMKNLHLGLVISLLAWRS